MRNQRNWREALLPRQEDALCLLWIAACFSLTSSLYLSWLYHLMTFVRPVTADLLSMGAGYLMQAAGTAGFLLLCRKNQGTVSPFPFPAAVGLLLLCALPALYSRALWVTVLFGMVLNLLCGYIGGYYLAILAALPGSSGRKGTQGDRKDSGNQATLPVKSMQGLVFGGGYALSTVIVWLISQLSAGSFLKGAEAMAAHALFALAALWMDHRLRKKHSLPATPSETAPSIRKETTAPVGEADQVSGGASQAIPAGEAQPSAGKKQPPWLLPLAAVVVIMMSLVKNLGFSFPSEDLEMGISLELSRIFYALGLVAAGLVTDRSRKNGAVLTLSALVLPFLMLSLEGEALPRFICWGLDYLLYGFFSVFRVVLFLDLAREGRKLWLAPLGLAAGRAGDALGTLLGIALSANRVPLILITAGLFAVTVFLFFRLYHTLWQSPVPRQRSEQEVFNLFVLRHDLSIREKEVLRLVLADQQIVEIADTLSVSESTVKFHIHNLLQKTGAKSRRELVQIYHTLLYADHDG